MIRRSIRRPVTVTMMYLILTILGAVAWQRIPIELLPNTSLPRLTVNASWPGASAEALEAFVTSPLEGSTVGMAAQSVCPGRRVSLQSRLSRIVPLVPITSTLN